MNFVIGLINMLDLNLVIVNYFNKEEVLLALASVFSDLKNSNLKYQVTIVDNSKNQDNIKIELENNFSDSVYVDAGGNIGFGKGNNLGFKSAPARYYLALNPDIVIPENSHSLETMIKFMDENPKIGCIGPKLLNADNSLQYSCFRFDRNSILIKPLKQINLDKKYKIAEKLADHLIMKDFNHNETKPVDWVLGAALLVRHEVVETVGVFDERYFMYLEDCDWCLRMWEAHWPVYYYPSVVMIHRHARESSKTPGVFKALFKNRYARAHLSSWIKYIWKWRKIYKYYS